MVVLTLTPQSIILNILFRLAYKRVMADFKIISVHFDPIILYLNKFDSVLWYFEKFFMFKLVLQFLKVKYLDPRFIILGYPL